MLAFGVNNFLSMPRNIPINLLRSIPRSFINFAYASEGKMIRVDRGIEEEFFDPLYEIA